MFFVLLFYVQRNEKVLQIYIVFCVVLLRFATVEVMQRYGLLLESFYENGEFVNDCIFTMMHHIGGDLGQVTTLFQPIILRTYAQIYATNYQLCEVSISMIFGLVQ